jgi:hypothetical protein
VLYLLLPLFHDPYAGIIITIHDITKVNSIPEASEIKHSSESVSKILFNLV